MGKRTNMILAMAAGAIVASAGFAAGGWSYTHRAFAKRSPAADLSLPGYSRQKVVYHVTETDGLTHRGYTQHVLQAAQNHVNAVGAENLDLRIVLQGDGLDLLSEAKTNPDYSRRVDKLKAEGVKFLVCRNTLVSRALDPAELYDVKTEDIVGAAVAEVSALQAQGFVYLKP
jgi:intracellular sulfur oxidation DsrE/DsrF family protein